MSSKVQQSEQKQEMNGPILTRPSSRARDRLHAAPRPQARLRQLQRSIGNQRVGRMLQKKLVVGPAGDEYEREADRIAEAVTSESAQPSSANRFLSATQPAAPLQRKCSCGGSCSSCQEEKEEKVQRKEAASAASSQAVSDAPPIVDEVLRSPGQPLDPATRAYFEPRFGCDFSGVRIHNDARAAKSAQDVNALAYTVGRDLVFASGQHAPHTGAGRRLLAHELTHTVQQSEQSIHAPLSQTPNLALSSRSWRPAIQRVPAASPCTPDETKRATKQVEAARTEALPFVGMAQLAINRLGSRWSSFKPNLLAGRCKLEGQVACAFNSNFNITPLDPNYGVRLASVESRLRGLRFRMAKPVATACQPKDDPQCTGKNRDTIAYVVNSAPPIHLCPQFRDDPNVLGQQATVIHEFAHFVPGVHDEGGYAFGGLGAETATCDVGVKFKAPSEVLANSADALTGFVMNIGQFGTTDLRVPGCESARERPGFTPPELRPPSFLPRIEEATKEPIF